VAAAERPHRRFAAGAERRFDEARTRFRADTNDTARAWQLGRAAFDWAEFARDHQHREAIALEGIAACRLALRRDNRLAPAHYYLGMNLGQLAQARKLEALGLVREMERCFRTARQFEETIDFAGPDRNLGLLYWRAPGWPASIGNRSQAREHLERAVRLGGEYPDNRLNLIEALLQWKDTPRLAEEVAAYAEWLPRARLALSGATWEQGWDEWDRRWEQLRREAERMKKR
jgi:tetratricopeptide (TPR) repeat protein